MAEFRTDPLRGHTVLINGDRGRRPSEFALEIKTPNAAHCAFCRGHEDATPPSIEQDSSPDWNWRIFPNRFPAVASELEISVANEWTAAAHGKHEVLVEHADHFAQAHEYSVAHWVEIFGVWQRRLLAHYEDRDIQYVHIFRNQGYRGGATLVHPHQQLVGLPLIPDAIAARLQRVEANANECAHCAWLQYETKVGERMLCEQAGIVALTAFAPRFPYEWQVMPREHRAFYELAQDELHGVARVLLGGLKSLAHTCGNPDYNLVLFSTPPGAQWRPLWTIDILPRISTQAGFEWGTGVHIVSRPPEEAAAQLKSNWVKAD